MYQSLCKKCIGEIKNTVLQFVHVDYDGNKLKGRGHNQSMSNFGLFFYFCSDLPNFRHVSYKLIGEHFSVFFPAGFLFVLKK